MLLKILAIVVIISVGFLISTTSLGSGGFVTTFLVSFGLFCILGLVALVMLAKKNSQKK